MFFRWLDGDVRNLSRRVAGGELSVGAALGALLRRRATAHPFHLVRDPGPVLARLRGSIRAGGGGGVPFDASDFGMEDVGPEHLEGGRPGPGPGCR